MFPFLGQIGPIPLRTYSILLDVTLLAALSLLAWRGGRVARRAVSWLDVGLIMLVAGVLGARLAHVAVHWRYFSETPAEIFAIWNGGLDWHGAVFAGAAALFIAAHLIDVDWRHIADTLSWMLPVGSALIYLGCLMEGCAYGQEVRTLADYPPLIAAELPDLYGITVPRLNSQLFGIVMSVLVLGLAWFLSRLIQRDGLRLWLVLSLLGLGAFGVGFARGDEIPVVGALRLDQIMDLGIAVGGLMMAGLAAWVFSTQPQSSDDEPHQSTASA